VSGWIARTIAINEPRERRKDQKIECARRSF